MCMIGIQSIVHSKFRKKISKLSKEELHLIHNYTLGLSLSKLNQVWTTDITYIHTLHEGTFYLISFIDQFSKKVVAWDLFDRQITENVIKVLKIAIKKRNPSPGLIIHSDKGSQMRSYLYRTFLLRHLFIFSYTSINHSCDENPAQESFHSLLKKEHLYQLNIYTFDDAYREIFNYIEGFYNPIRIHSSIGYFSPNQFENQLFS